MLPVSFQVGCGGETGAGRDAHRVGDFLTLPDDARHLVATTGGVQHLVADGRQLLQRGRDLISDITRARTPMPKSAQEYIERCEAYAARCARAETRA